MSTQTICGGITQEYAKKIRDGMEVYYPDYTFLVANGSVGTYEVQVVISVKGHRLVAPSIVHSLVMFATGYLQCLKSK